MVRSKNIAKKTAARSKYVSQKRWTKAFDHRCGRTEPL